MGTKALLTANELEQMPDHDPVRTELDERERIAMPPTKLEHGYLEHGYYEGRIASIGRSRIPSQHRVSPSSVRFHAPIVRKVSSTSQPDDVLEAPELLPEFSVPIAEFLE
jgi:hypothetical protein